MNITRQQKKGKWVWLPNHKYFDLCKLFRANYYNIEKAFSRGDSVSARHFRCWGGKLPTQEKKKNSVSAFLPHGIFADGGGSVSTQEKKNPAS